MKATLISCFIFVAAMICQGKGPMIPTVQRNGQSYVRMSSLTSHEDIVVKQLPSNGQWVVCARELCVLLKDVSRDGDETWVSVAALSEALGATARFDGKKEKVAFEFQDAFGVANSPATRPGNLVPNFRVTRLDGTPVSVADFAGKRVLINSWASW